MKLLLLLAFNLICSSFLVDAAGQTPLQIHYFQKQETIDLSQLKGSERVRRQAIESETGKRTEFSGILLGVLIQKTVAKLSSEENAQIDWIRIEADGGKKTLLPRAFAMKNEILIADRKKNEKMLSLRLLPVREKKSGDFFPSSAVYLNDVKSIEFIHSKDFFGKVTLTKRTDPTALRGERWMIQNCLACHGRDGAESTHTWMKKIENTLIESFQHPVVNGFEELPKKEWNSIFTFLAKFKEEGAANSAAKTSFFR